MGKKKTKVSKPWKAWTPAEEDAVIDAIGKNPTNLRWCFFIASQTISRSPAAISSHYYTKMANNPDVVALLTVGRTSVIKNKKRLKSGEQPVEIKRSLWDKILSWLKF